MISNNNVKAGALPIVSKEEQVKVNSTRLYAYLVAKSSYINDDYAFTPKGKRSDFTRNVFLEDIVPNRIYKEIGMGDKTFHDYIVLLEENDLISYDGPQLQFYENDEGKVCYRTGRELWKMRKKYKRSRFILKNQYNFVKYQKKRLIKF